MAQVEHISIDSRDATPIYAQLDRALRAAIATGRLKVGEQLPTVRQLAVELSVNANTVARVYTELERAGVLETRRGVGSFVAATPAAGASTRRPSAPAGRVHHARAGRCGQSGVHHRRCHRCARCASTERNVNVVSMGIARRSEDAGGSPPRVNIVALAILGASLAIRRADLPIRGPIRSRSS